MNRREFNGHLATGALGIMVAGTSFELTGCNVFSDLANWIPVGINSFNAILALLSTNGITLPAPVQLIANAIVAGLNALVAAIKEYEATTPAPVGALAKIKAILQDVVDNFGTFLQGLGISGGLFTLIASLVQIILSTISGFTNQLPQSAVKTATLGYSVRVGNNMMVPILPEKRTKRVFKRSWNQKLDNGKAMGVSVPASAYLKVSFFERF